MSSTAIDYTPDTSLAENPFLESILEARGVRDKVSQAEFLFPSREHFHDARLLRNIERAAKRICRAIRANERIVIYSDYDTDGIPGGVILHDFFKNIGYENFQNYIPHRYTEGFGLNMEALASLKDAGAKLLITVDCGITGVREVLQAREWGIDVVITDHHNTNGAIPAAYATVNPKCDEDSYPNKNICGAGIAYKLAQTLTEVGGFGLAPEVESSFLEMVGIATLSDMVPLLGENRALAYFGLSALRKSKRPGLLKLLELSKTKQKTLTEDDVLFTIAPRLNAASRMDHPEHAFTLLSTRDPLEAEKTARRLSALNDERKGAVAAMVKEVHRKISSMREIPDVFVLGNISWRPGLLGLAANAVVETYGRPAFLWGREGSREIKGSCRSDGSINVVELMKRAEDSFLEYGGHDYSGGFSVSGESIHFLSERLNSVFRDITKNETLEEVSVDGDLSLSHVNWHTWSALERLSPFGTGNPKPLFRFRNVIPSLVRIFGKDDNHLELVFEDGRKTVRAISFFKKPQSFRNVPMQGRPLDLFAHFDHSFFKGSPELRLRIVDIL